MASHFATDALLWYWGEENLRIRSQKALDGRPVDSMPMAEQRPLPAWAMAIGNSRLLMSQTGAGFVIDAGYKGLQPKLDELHCSRPIEDSGGHVDHALPRRPHRLCATGRQPVSLLRSISRRA